MRTVFVASIATFFLSVIAPYAEATECIPGVIRTSETTNRTQTGFTLVWSAPSGDPADARYDVMRNFAPSWCPLETRTHMQERVAQVTGTSYAVTFGPPNTVQCYFVRLSDCPQVAADFCYLADTLGGRASKPNLISANASGPGQVTLTYSHPDEKTQGVTLFRALGQGTYEFVEFAPICPVGVVHSFTDYGTGSAATGGTLVPETYRYLLTAYTEEDGNVSSDEKTVVVGGICTPPQIAPQVSTPNQNVIAGQPATVNWTTTETVERFVIEVATNPGFNPLLHSFRKPGSERAASASFPEPGVYYVRVAAENACGRKDGVPTLRFDVSPPPARVAVTAKPSGMLQVIGQPASDSYTLTNFGGSPTTIQLAQSGGNFFTQSPAEFTLAPRTSQSVILNAAAQAAGNYQGESIPQGDGVPPGLSVPVRLLAATQPSGNPDAQAEVNRVDVSAPLEGEPTGSIRFTNRGTGSVKGLLLSDVPWIIPQDEFINIAAGQSATFTFRINRALRPSTIGSVAGRLLLVYLQGSSSGKLMSLRRIFGSTPPPGSKATVVSVTDTVKPPVTATGIPALTADQVAFFVPGVGRIPTSGGVMTADVSVLNADSLATIEDLQVFFTSAAATTSQSTTFTNLSSDQTLKLTDVSKSVFSSEGQIGSLQLRTGSFSSIAVNATLSVDATTGTYGTAVPVFRSDRTIAAQEKLYLTGLRKDSNTRTDMYLQEMVGQAGTAVIEFRSATGLTVENRNVSVPAFTVTQLPDVVPLGAVAAILTNTSTTDGKLQAYATPIDTRTNDTWSVADWSRYYGYAGSDVVVIPVGGKVRGLNSSDYRTDIAIMNTGTASASGTLSYLPQVGPRLDRVLTLGGRESRILEDVVATLFNITSSTIGSFLFTPTTGTFVVTSRTYTVSVTGSTFSTAVPAVALGSALELGEVKKIGGIEDATLTTSYSAKSGTYRSNFGLLETAGAPVTVRATLRYSAVQGSAAAVGVSSLDFSLQPNEFVMFNSITNTILQSRRAEFGDLRDIQVDFEVVEGAGEVLVFVTTMDNATSDAIFRDE